MKYFKNIGTVLIFPITLTVALALSGIILYVSSSTRELTLQKAKQSLGQSGETVQLGLEQYRNSATSLLHILAADSAVLSAFHGGQDAAQARIAATVAANPQIETVA